MEKQIDISSYFIGGKAENADIYREITNDLIDDHMGWRKNFMPGDKEFITESEKRTEEFQAGVAHMKEVLHELSSRLRDSLIPWDGNGRYWGHMNNETLMPAILAYNFAILWNGNNVAWEGAPATTLMEKEVGNDLVTILGLGKNGWGHIVADGTLANLEALWYAREVAQVPLAVREVCPELVEGKSEWELLNMSVKDMLDLLDKTGDKINAVKSVIKEGKFIKKIGKLLVPATMHYSWPKAVDVTGIGEDNLVTLPIDSHYRTDIEATKKIILNLAKEGTPVLGVVAVIGSTEEGSVDHVDKLVALREELRKQGIDFVIHVDAAYGGYGRTMYLDENNEFIPYEDLEKTYKKYGIFTEDNQFMDIDVYNGYKGIEDVDTVTIDPHKTGFVPYDAGGIAIKDTRMKNLVSFAAPYAFEKGEKVPVSIGLFTLEGSKPGASAAAVWAAHKVLPINVTGYGKLIARTLEGAKRFYNFVNGMEFEVNGKKIKSYAVYKPDFQMVDWVYKEEGNNSLADMNKLTELVFKYTSSSKGGPLYSLDFLTSHSIFMKETYGNAPRDFIESLGIDGAQYDKDGNLHILRGACMSAYMHDKDNFEYMKPRLKAAIQDKLQKIYDNEDM